MLESWRAAVGTLTAIPVTPPRCVDREVAGPAMVMAPLAVVPLGLLVALLMWGGRELGLAPLGVAAAAVGALALGSRAFHLDGLADTADGLTASYSTERSLAVMKTGDVGPAGAGALVMVLGVQIASLASIVTMSNGPWLAALLVCVSRGAVVVTCMRGVPGARVDGLGSTYVETIPRTVTVLSWAVLSALMCGGFLLVDEPWWRGVVCAGAALVVVASIVHRAVARLGGVTGDIFGACIEISLAAMLLAST
ncbi:adenosylcobinamide-GDP ribazoletransferase [Aeromicrobium sp.]|uniref:adenosylcobinamide-GDP ribazoletransferase n=1 Tax=Aeromicrobium sp. TaxID=1871063 RepID=UPI0019C08625|nr:adenosylcobinamide-GDP ribazoletransferase [Aeromicrobium sp.]MBC7630630.1 adenosylcobinamide-GDP ribazoletransferase [Aeromicrobium sp.]